MPPHLQVIKASGDVQDFEPAKLRKFLIRIRVPEAVAAEIVTKAEMTFQGQCSTADIARFVVAELKNKPLGKLLAARYNIKSNLRKMGPAGYVFEKFVGRLFQMEGYEIEVGVQVQGKCAEHEIDVIATRGEQKNWIECKFHNKEGTKSDINIALYNYARFLDIMAGADKEHTHRSWLATNTKPTNQALKYARCIDMQVLTIEIPYGASITERIILHDAFPISTISILDPYLEKLFLAEKTMMSDIIDTNIQVAAGLSIPAPVWQQAQIEAKTIIEESRDEQGLSLLH